METTTATEIDQVLARFRQGQLTEPALRQALERRRPPANAKTCCTCRPPAPR